MIEFFVAGLPAPGGSKRGIVHRHTGKVVMLDMAPRGKDWRASVAHAGAEAMRAAGCDPFTGPLQVWFTFTFPRPRCHYGSGRNADKLKASAPYYHAKAPDTTKLVRAAEDSLKNICWSDDSLIVHQVAAKFWGAKPGLRLAIRPLRADGQGQGEVDS